jgi:hypothetical protein
VSRSGAGSAATAVTAGDLAGGSFSSELPAERSGQARRRALVSGTLVGTAGVAVTGALTIVIWQQQAQGRSPASLAMASEHMDNMGKFWSFPLLQASGLAGLVFAYLSVLLGLQQSARALGWLPLSYRQIDRLHRQISLLVIALVLVHVVTTALDAMGDSWKPCSSRGSRPSLTARSAGRAQTVSTLPGPVF